MTVTYPAGTKGGKYSSTHTRRRRYKGRRWLTPRHATVSPGKTPPLYRWVIGPRTRSRHVRKISPLPGFEPRLVQPVASRYTEYAVPATVKVNTQRPETIYVYIYIYISFFFFAEQQ